MSIEELRKLVNIVENREANPVINLGSALTSMGEENYRKLYNVVVNQLFIKQNVSPETIINAVREILANIREYPFPKHEAK